MADRFFLYSILSALWIFNIFVIADCATCTYYSASRLTSKYCSSGCCGNTNSQYCCSSLITINSTNIAVGCVVGGIVLVAFIVAFLTYYKKRGRRGRVVVAPSSNKTVTVHTTATSHSVPATAPPAYNAGTMYPPPTYPPQPGPSGALGPAYPPPPYSYGHHPAQTYPGSHTVTTFM